MQVDRRRLLEADLGADHDLARYPADGRGEGCDRDRGEAPDHVLPREDEHGPPAVGPREGELPDLAAGYFGHRCAPRTGANSSSVTGCRPYASASSRTASASRRRATQSASASCTPRARLIHLLLRSRSTRASSRSSSPIATIRPPHFVYTEPYQQA